MNVTDNGRAITTVTVVRTHSLRETPRLPSREEQCPIDNGILKNHRSLSNDKIASDCKTSFIPQRGSSLRHNGKTAFPISSPISNNHHSFQVIKPIDTSPRTSESVIDSQKFKFKPRTNNSSQGGPLIPDHSLKMDSQRESKYTPRPPLSKRFSSDQDEANSDIDSNQSGKNNRSYSIPIQKVSSSKPLRSPTRAIPQNLKGDEVNCQNSMEKTERNTDLHDDYINGVEDNFQSDCETPALLPYHVSRSSLRKGADSPNHSDTPSRYSPSPTKTVKWNPNLSAVKSIPNRVKTSKPKIKPKPIMNKNEQLDNPHKVTDNEIQSTVHINLELMESHGLFINHSMIFIKNQASLLENFRQDKISLSSYQKDLIDQIENQRKLVTNFHMMLTTNASPSFGGDKPLSNFDS